ncbi:MAG: hypothetical protein KDA68_22025, partial [Planctomycetaceae bacterium]|nr:hypothetical protein [Planctomycetaceae bacterium]
MLIAATGAFGITFSILKLKQLHVPATKPLPDTSRDQRGQVSVGGEIDPADRQFKLSLVQRLIKNGWPEETAKAVVHINLDRYSWLKEVAGDALEKEIRAYECMAPSPKVAALLTIHPEVSGLALMAYDRETFADAILNLDDPGDQNVVIDTFVKFTSPADVSAWGSAVHRHGPCIAGILRKCPVWPVESVFLYPKANDEVAEEYGKWIDGRFERHPFSPSDEEIFSMITFVQACGSKIRTRMENDETFLRSFNGRIWPAFEDIVRKSTKDRDAGRVPWEFFTDCDAIWSLLQRDDGRALLDRGGQLAAELLYGEGPERVIPELREKAVQLLLASNQDLIAAAFFSDWSKHPLFVELMVKRNLTEDMLLTCCNKLRVSDDPVAQLEQWHRLSDNALMEDVGPLPQGLKASIPGYAVYYA